MDKIVHLLTGNVSWVKIIILNPHLNPLFLYIEKVISCSINNYYYYL